MENNTKEKQTTKKGLYNNEKRNLPMIIFDNVEKKYNNGVDAVKNLSFQIEEGEFVFLMGSSGAGKSTLIKLILLEETPTSGRIFVNSHNVSKIRKSRIQRYRRSIGVFFQDFRLLEKKTVFQNVAFAMEITGASKKEITEKVDITLSLMGLTAKRNDYPGQLSGGEQQRVALARAIVNGPDILIADEPTGNLDPENSAEIMALLQMINSYGTTVLVATHEQYMAEKMGKRVIVLNHGHTVSEKELKKIPTKEALEENLSEKPVEIAKEEQNKVEQPSEPVQVEIPVASINFASLQQSEKEEQEQEQDKEQEKAGEENENA